MSSIKTAIRFVVGALRRPHRSPHYASGGALPAPRGSSVFIELFRGVIHAPCDSSIVGATRYGKQGATFIDVLIGLALLIIVFLGIYGAFQLSTTFVGQNRVRAGGVALANEGMEYIRSLPYESAGTVGGVPAGSVPQTETLSLNGIDYTRRAFIAYVDDPKDGLGAADENGIITDYKVAKVEVSWLFRGSSRKVSLVSHIVPAGIETTAPGGVLLINVLTASGAPLSGASVSIVNASTSPAINISTFSNTQGKATLLGAPAATGYEITVAKEGYSAAQTYGATAANPNPSPGHLSVALNQTTSATFQIDLLGQDTVRTYLIGGGGQWQDSFTDSSLIATSSNVLVGNGDVVLAQTGGLYEPAGDFQGATITPAALLSWGELSFTSSTNASTTALVRVYYNAAGAATLVPEEVLPGNAAGFSSSPLSLANISTTTYPALILKGFLATIDSAYTPRLLDWKVTYTAGATPLPNIAFALRGEKTIGTNGTGAPIYKFSNSYQTDSGGYANIPSLEWDTYTHSITTAGYDVAESCSPQPVPLNPGASVDTNIILAPDTTHSLLVAVRNATGALVPGASVQLHKSGFDATKTSSSCGQAFFSGLSSGTYSIDISAVGYQNTTITDISVSGESSVGVSFP